MPFNTQALELKKIFNDLVPGFGINHARAYYSLLSSDVKTAKQLIHETGVNQATTYAVLRDLLKWELIMYSNTNPTSYYIGNPLKTFERQVKKREKVIFSKRRQLEDLIAQDTDESEKFLIKIGKGHQTKLMNVITKKELKYRGELMQVKESLDKMLKEAPEKEKRYAYACYKPLPAL